MIMEQGVLDLMSDPVYMVHWQGSEKWLRTLH